MSQHNSVDPICCVTFRDANGYRGCSGRRHKSFQSNSNLAQSVWGKFEKRPNARPHFILVSFQQTKAHLVRVAHAHAAHPFPDNHFAREFVLSSSGGCLQSRLSVPVPVPSPEVSRLWLWVFVRFFDICNAVHSVTVLVESTDRFGPK